MVNVADVNVLAEFGTATWPARQSVAYETALEGVSQLIGWYAGMIAREEAKSEPDAEAIDGWREQQRAVALRGQELRPWDMDAIERVRKEAEHILAGDEEDGDPDEDGEDDGDPDDTVEGGDDDLADPRD